MVGRLNQMKPKYRCNENFFSEGSEASFYVAGFIAADGCIQDTGKCATKRLTIHLSMTDIDVLKLIRKLLNSDHKIEKRGTSCELRIGSNTLCNDLKRIFNIGPRKSKKYCLPNELVSHPLIKHFIRGYIDGDGCFHKTKPSKSHPMSSISLGILGTRKLLRQFRQVFSINCATSVRQKVRGIPYCKPLYLLYYKGDAQLERLTEYLYDGAKYFLRRKYKIAKEAKPLPYRTNTYQSQLTEQEVRAIRKLLSEGMSGVDIAKLFNVHKGIISTLKLGQTYKWVK